MRNIALTLLLGVGIAACVNQGGTEAPAIQVAPGEISAELILDRVP